MLCLTVFRGLTKCLYQRPVVYFSVADPNRLVYSYQGNTENNDKYKKLVYQLPLNKKRRIEKEKEEFEKLKQKIQETIEDEIKGGAQKIEAKENEDVLFKKNEMPQVRKYDKVVAKELYYLPRTTNLHDYNNRKITYLTEFQGPFEIHDDRIAPLLDSIKKRLDERFSTSLLNFQDPDFDSTPILQSDPEIVKALEELRYLITKANFRVYPNIALYLAINLRYKEDFAKVWATLEQELFKVLHNMSTIEIAKLKFVLCGFFPKSGSPTLHKALVDIATEDLTGATVPELLHLFHAFRLLPKDKIYTKIVQQLQSKGKVLSGNNPEELVNILYTYANCRLKKHQRRKFRDPKEEIKEANNLIEVSLPELENSIATLPGDSLVRLALTLMIVRTTEFGDIIAKIERAVKKRSSEFDAFQTANLIYTFSKMNNGASAGKDSFYKDLEPNAIKYKDEFNSLELSRIFYAYAQRGLASKELLEKVILPWAHANMEDFSYSELGNVAYGLMFIESTDKELWRKFACNISVQKNRCPITVYAPIKYARYYLDIHFPQWDYSFYEDTCFEAERYFNTNRLMGLSEQPEYSMITYVIKNKYRDTELKFWLEWDNLFIVHFAKPHHKFGILIRTETRDYLHNSNEAHPLFKLKKKILEGNGWSVLDLDFKAF